MGHEIPQHDTDTIHDIAEGRKIVYYHESVDKEKEKKSAIRKLR